MDGNRKKRLHQKPEQNTTRTIIIHKPMTKHEKDTNAKQQCIMENITQLKPKKSPMTNTQYNNKLYTTKQTYPKTARRTQKKTKNTTRKAPSSWATMRNTTKMVPLETTT